MDDWGGTWHHCGGIYSARICCPEYVQTVIQVISSLPSKELWTYQTACESSETGGIEFGQFFIRDGKMYVPDDGNNYAGCFDTGTTKFIQRASPLSIHEAAERGDLATVRKQIGNDHTLIEARGPVGVTPLRCAAGEGRSDVVKFLLTRGAKVNVRDGLGWSPLHLARWSKWLKKNRSIVDG